MRNFNVIVPNSGKRDNVTIYGNTLGDLKQALRENGHPVENCNVQIRATGQAGSKMWTNDNEQLPPTDMTLGDTVILSPRKTSNGNQSN